MYLSNRPRNSFLQMGAITTPLVGSALPRTSMNTPHQRVSKTPQSKALPVRIESK